MRINQIENNVNEPVGGYKYPFSGMKAGQSVLIEGNEDERLKARKCVYMTQHRSNKKFKTRTEGQALRVWRVK